MKEKTIDKLCKFALGFFIVLFFLLAFNICSPLGKAQEVIMATPLLTKTSSNKPIPIIYFNLKNNSEKVYTLYVTDNSFYVIDKRIDMCFYQVFGPTGAGVAVTKVDCKKFNNLLEGLFE